MTAQDQAPTTTAMPGWAPRPATAALAANTAMTSAPPATAAPPAPAASDGPRTPESGSSAGDGSGAQDRRPIGTARTASQLAGELALLLTDWVARRADPEDADLVMTEDEQAGAARAGRIAHRHVQLPGNASWDDAADAGAALLAVASWAARYAGKRLRTWRDQYMARRQARDDQAPQ